MRLSAPPSRPEGRECGSASLLARGCAGARRLELAYRAIGARGAYVGPPAQLTFQNSTISSGKTEHPAERRHERRRKAASARRVLRAARSNLGGTDRTKADFRNLREHL